VLAATLAALLLRLHCLYFDYLWLDEFVTLWSLQGANLAEMLDRSLRWTAHGPLFVLSFRGSLALAGDPIWGLKLPVILCGSACVGLTWWATRRIFSRDDVALAASWFVALDPDSLAFSQTGRPYVPAVLLLIASTGFLAGWLHRGGRRDLVATVLCASAAVGFHLVSSLAWIAQNLAVLYWGLSERWAKRRWCDWLAAQSVGAILIGIVGGQVWRLSDRHAGLIFETGLPMLSRYWLDQRLIHEIQIERMALLGLITLGLLASRLPHIKPAQACANHWTPLCLALGSYLIPTVLVSLMATARLIDSFPRYYFLFSPGLLMGLAWAVTLLPPAKLARPLTALVCLLMMLQYDRVGGVLNSRSNSNWFDFPAASAELRARIKPDDLVLSRASLIEGNDLKFLTDPTGASYLKCFLEAKDGPLPGKHIPLPFSPESTESIDYLNRIAQEELSNREHFWLVNVGPADYDYRAWINAQFQDSFIQAEEWQYKILVVSRYVRSGAK
jgi:uncharacterized membrane protein